MYFYQKIKDAREDRDLKQSEIANILDITQQQYSLYESGKREFPLNIAVKLSKFYNISLDQLTSKMTKIK